MKRIIAFILSFTLILTPATFAERQGAVGWDLERTGAAWYSQTLASLNKTRQVVVAVVDTGFSSNASVFNDRVLPGYNTAKDNADTTDTDGHGTAMASVIAYTTYYNPNIKILPIKIDNNGDIRANAFSSGIDYAVERGVDVINISVDADVRGNDNYVLGIESAVRNAVSRGITVVVSSGNDGADTRGWSPARMSEVLCVASINENSAISKFSNYGDSVDFAAPGENVITVRPDNDYYESGTSPAAAHISGIAALLKLNFPSATGKEIHHILQVYSDGNGWNKNFGWGVPNLKITPIDTSRGSLDVNNYIDIHKHWGKSAIGYLVSRQVINGHAYIDGLYEFWPEESITRAEFATFLARDSGDNINGRWAYISDIETNDWFAQSAYWAYEKGIVTGYEDESFRPQSFITRQEMAAMLVRYADYKGKYLPTHGLDEWAEYNKFNDDSEIAEWAVFYMRTMQRAGIINGDDWRNGKPKNNATRAESATMLYNFLTK